MNFRAKAFLLGLSLLVFALAGCETPFHNPGGYLRIQTVKPMNSHIVSTWASTGKNKKSEYLSVDVWPLAGVGVGLIGARANVFPLQVGVGGWSYPPRYPNCTVIISTGNGDSSHFIVR